MTSHSSERVILNHLVLSIDRAWASSSIRGAYARPSKLGTVFVGEPSWTEIPGGGGMSASPELIRMLRFAPVELAATGPALNWISDTRSLLQAVSGRARPNATRSMISAGARIWMQGTIVRHNVTIYHTLNHSR